MEKYTELGNRTIKEAKNDLERLNDPTSLSYNDNWMAESMRSKYGMDSIELMKVVQELDMKEEADRNNELYRRGELR